jgi:hypothetical protein
MTPSRHDLTIDEPDPAAHAIETVDHLDLLRLEDMLHFMAPEIAPFDRSASVVRHRGETSRCIGAASQLCGAP